MWRAGYRTYIRFLWWQFLWDVKYLTALFETTSDPNKAWKFDSYDEAHDAACCFAPDGFTGKLILEEI